MTDYRVSSGVTSTGVIVGDGDTLFVSSGGTAINTTVESGGRVVVNGGSMDIVDLTGEISLNGGGHVNDITLNYGAFLFIYDGTGTQIRENGGYVNLSTAMPGAFVPNVFSGYAFAGDHYWASIHSGTTGTDLSVRYDGAIEVFSSGLAQDVTVSYGGILNVYAGGTVDGFTINNYGNLEISSGGKLTGKMTFQSEANVSAYDGAIVDFDLTQTAPGADALVNDLSLVLNQPFFYTLTVDGTEAFGVYKLAEGASGFNKTITVVNTLGEELGTLAVAGGTQGIGNKQYRLSLNASLLSVTISDRVDLTGDLTGSATLTSGMIGSSVNILYNGLLCVSNGGIASNTTVNSGGDFIVSSGGTVNDTTVSANGFFMVSSGGTANSTTLKSSAYMHISSGGTADVVTVDTNALLRAYTGGTATQIRENGGYVSAHEGATVTFVSNSFDGVILTSNARCTVHSGTTANNTTIERGTFEIYSGGTANNTILNSGRITIESGGSASRTTVGYNGAVSVSGGSMDVVDLTGELALDGGSINDITLNYGAVFYVLNGAISQIRENGGYVDWLPGAAGTLFVSNAFSGYAYNDESTWATLHSGTTGTDLSAYAGGGIEVFYGGLAQNVTISKNGTLDVYAGGTIDGLKLNNLGILNIASNGMITGKISFQSGAIISAYDGAIVDFDLTQTVPGADALVNDLSLVLNQPFFYTLTVDGTEAFGVYKLAGGASGFDKTITVVNTLGEELGTLAVADGMQAIGDRKYTLNLDASGLAVTVNDLVDLTGDLTGTFELTSGMIASGVNVLSGGSLNVLNGGSASMTTINSKGIMYVISGGNADGVTANSGGDLYVSSGGTATQIVENGGYVNVSDGATATFIPNSFGGSTFSDRNWATIHSGTTGTDLTAGKDGLIAVVGGIAQNITVGSSGTLSVNDGGTADNVTVNQGFGRIYVQNSGTVNSATVSSGTFYISSGGTANSTTVSSGSMQVSRGVASNTTLSGGRMYIDAGGVADTTTVTFRGSMYVHSGGTADSVTVSSGGLLGVSSGGTANNVVWTPCVGQVVYNAEAYVTFVSQYSGVYYGANNQLLSNAQVMESKTVSDDTYGSNVSMYVMSGGTANDTTVNSGGHLYVSAGGTANSTTVNAGYIYVYSGGTANCTTVNNGVYMYVSSGATADSTTINSLGYMGVMSGGTANNITLTGGWLNVSSGGTATDVVWTPCVGQVLFEPGAYVTFVSQYSGVYYGADNQLLSSAGVMNSKTVSDKTHGPNMSMYVMSGGTANYTTVNSGGSIYVLSGGTANSTTVNSRGYLYVSEGGTANNTTLNSVGHMYVSYGGTANYTTVNSGGGVSVFHGGMANSATLNFDGYMYVSWGGMATGATVKSGGSCFVYVDGNVTDTTVNNGGILTVYSGGTTKNTTVNSKGKLIVDVGGKFTGKMRFATGAIVSAYDGAIVDFDLRETTAGADALLNNLSFFGTRAVNYTLTVDGTEDAGTYRLVDNVASFDKTITVVNTSGVELGTLSVKARTQTIGGQDYTLTLNGDSLCVVLGEYIPPVDLTGALYTSADLTEGMYGSSVSIGKPGLLTVFEGGLAHRTTVNSGGKLYVPGGSATETTVNPSGEFNLFGGTASSTTVNNGSLGVYSCGMANDTIISGGTFYIHDGTANNTTVSSGGTLKVAYGGKLTGKMTFEYGAVVSAYYGAILDFDISALEPGSDIRINDLSRVSVPDWGANYTLTVSGTQANGKYKLAEGAAGFDKTISVVNTSGVELGTLTVGQTANIDGQDYKLTLDGGSLGVTIGGQVDLSGDLSSEFDLTSGMIGSSVNILNGGELYVLEGATADTVAVNPGGYLGVYSGGSASGIVAEEGACLGFTIAPDTYMQGTYAGKAFEITDNTANGITVMSGGCLFASDGGKATDTTVESGGYFELNYGCEANGVTVASGGSLNALGSASGIVAEEGAHLEFYVAPGAYVQGTYGGSAFEIDSSVSGYAVHSGRLNIYEDGTADDVTVESGGEFVIYGGTATNIVENGGYVTILDDAVVTFAAHEFTGGTVQSPRTVTAHSGTIVTDTTLESGGVLEIHEGGIAKNTTVNADGCLDLEEGGIAKNITVNDGGFVEVSNNGKLTGKLTFESGATLYAYVGAILDFDLTQTAPGADALMNGVAHALVTTGFLYTLTVDGTEAAGDYKLAEEAVDFDYDDVITVVNTSGEELGTLSVDGGTQTLGGRDYTLTLTDDDTLCVTIEGGAPSPGNMFFSGDFNGDLFDTLAVESGSTVTIYQNGEAWGLGVTLDPGWTVVGTGDFSGDGLDDFLRVNTEGYVVGEMSNGNGTFSPQVLNLKNTGWEILGTGDFNGNGTDDVLIANPTGASETVGLLGYWESGVTWTLINGYSPEWECVATGDYNGDGKCDMLWKNSFVGDGGLTYNAYCTWIVDNPVDWRMVSVANPAEWNFLCAGDFNGDKMNDIAMINDVGVVGIWGVTDGYLSSWSILSAVTSEWQLAGVADFNADGTDDIAWSNVDTGLTGYWQIENKELASWANIATIS